MHDFTVMLNDVNIIDNRIRIDTAVVCPSDIVTPKMRVIFERGEEIRRLPLRNSGSLQRNKNGDTIVIFSYAYLINYLFTDHDTGDISVKFEVSFGDDCYENIPFTVSRGVASKRPDIFIDEIYIGGEIFDGVTLYSNIEPPQQEDYDYEFFYSCIPEPENDRLIIKAEENPNYNKHTFSWFVSEFFKGILTVLVVIGCILLIPMFVLDAFLAALDIVSQREYKQDRGFVSNFIGQYKTNVASFLKLAFKNRPIANKVIMWREGILVRYYKILCKKPIKKNRIAFISGRRDELGGNELFVYNLIKDREDIEFKFLISSELSRKSGLRRKSKFYKLYATSKVVIVDDYYDLLNTVEKREDVVLFQLWHACGAFKTFGFSRLGKYGGPRQTSPNHRMYDYTIVSSDNIIKYYAEGFGISDKHVLPTGIPRTDIFTDKEYAENVRKDFYERYPQLKDKKIALFAPTFRGMGQNSAYYPVNVFDANKFYENCGKEYAVLIKLHPFCTERLIINENYKDYIIDLSEEDELNDLLFVTDLLITDYSSCVFEASLLNIPMLFYAYDLYQYISERDFYCNFESFVPGKIVFNQDELEKSVNEKTFNAEKIEPFKHKFFSNLDGKSSERVADIILKSLDS